MCGTSTTSSPKPGAYVFTTWRTCGLSVSARTIFVAIGNDVLRDEAGIRGDGRAVVPGRVGHVHPGQLADQRLVLEDRLQHALAHLGLIRRVRGQELAAGENDVHDRRDVVVVDPRPEEGELGARVDVPRRELLDVTHELGLAERGRNVELAVETDARRHLLEELVDGRDADRREHLLAVGVGEAQVAGAHWLGDVRPVRLGDP